jgi:uncharacterized protein YjbJ (UPF0337 family)
MHLACRRAARADHVAQCPRLAVAVASQACKFHTETLSYRALAARVPRCGVAWNLRYHVLGEACPEGGRSLRQEKGGSMNTDVLRGKWNQLKGKVRRQWGDLTDDDVDKIQGDSEVLLGRIQERYGRTREEAEREVDRWLTGA